MEEKKIEIDLTQDCNPNNNDIDNDYDNNNNNSTNSDLLLSNTNEIPMPIRFKELINDNNNSSEIGFSLSAILSNPSITNPSNRSNPSYTAKASHILIIKN